MIQSVFGSNQVQLPRSTGLPQLGCDGSLPRELGPRILVDCVYWTLMLSVCSIKRSCHRSCRGDFASMKSFPCLVIGFSVCSQVSYSKNQTLRTGCKAATSGVSLI